MASNSRTSELAALIGGSIIGRGDPVVSDVTHDSRQVQPGVLFVAMEGQTLDGHQFVEDAISRGAAAVMVQRPLDIDTVQILSGDTRADLGSVAAAVHENPSSDLSVVGVTGTNGKTTITHYVHSIGRQCGFETGLVGTIEIRAGERTLPSLHTTPEASDFQRLLAVMRDEGIAMVASEVSSHALALGRVRGTDFKVAAFTNLSQDHLDFHGSMESYAEAKKSLFRDYEVSTAVINVDDRLGSEIAQEFSGDLVTVGANADVRASDIVLSVAGSSFDMSTPWGRSHIEAPVIGGFNVSNLVMAAAICLSAGLEFQAVAEAMGSVDKVPGRFEVVSGKDPVLVVVDYAHTPAGVSTAIEAASSLGSGRVIALLGAGGDRDKDKRPKMGAALGVADRAIVTSDNPRSEDPLEIAESVASGSDRQVEVIVDRRNAIEAAIADASEGDVVLVLGRGHEPGQQFESGTIPFDDREVASAVLAAARKSTKDGTTSGSMGT